MRSKSTGRRRLQILAVLASLVTALSGCTVAQGFGIARDDVPASALCPGKPRAAHITVIHFWHPTATPAWLDIAPAFNCAHPDLAVDISPVPQVGDDNDGKLLAATAAHKPPDLVLSYDDVLTAWAARGQLQPLDDLAAQHGIKRDDYIDQAWLSTLWQGKQYGIPADWDPDTLLWWNKKVFADAGLDPDKPPTTWEELHEYAAKIDKVNNGKIERLGFVPWAGWQFGYLQIAQQWNAVTTDGADPASAIVDSPGMRKAFQYQAESAQKYGGSAKVDAFTSSGGAQGAAADPLMSGKIGMELIGDWQLGQQANVGPDEFRKTIGVTAMPHPPGGKTFLCHSGWSYMVPVGSPHRAEAMEFVEFAQQPEVFAKYLGETHGWISARKITRQQPYITQDPTWQAIVKIDEEQGYDWWLQPSPIIQQYYRILDQAQSATVSLKTAPDAAVIQAQEQVNAALLNAKATGVYSNVS